MTLEERLSQLAAEIGGVGKAADLCGVSRTTFHAWVKGSKLPLDAAAKLADATGVTLDWLATGHDRRSEMKKTNDENDVGTIAPPMAEEARKAGQEIRWLGSGLAPVHIFEIAELRDDGFDPNRVEYVRMEGEAMAPTLRDGDFAFFDRSKTRLRNRRVYALVIDGNIVIRRAFVAPDRDPVLKTDTPGAAPDITDLGPVQILGRVFSVDRGGGLGP